ncbi:MAG TPA: hypothetical protein ENL07_00505 [Chlorobaculum parvum]|uniref:DUF3618 domain-containing protein n=1 Tax=Chlorobaculum parvum TaxID=274539 RepID=A0A7C5HDI5_9CHLB|nr:hypothetical protein [Chlorobaculum parvum]
MTNANDPLKSIQSRIDELEQTISERREQIKARTHQLKEDMQDELSPVELVKRHPLESAGISFITGILAGRIVRGLISTKTPRTAKKKAMPSEPAFGEETIAVKPSALKAAMGAIGIELLNTGKDLAITWAKNQFDSRTRKPV